jgi:hypothetical protein
MRRADVEAQLLDQAREPGRLACRQLHDEPRQRRGVDDGMGQRALEAASDQPGVKRVVTVLDEHSPLRES